MTPMEAWHTISANLNQLYDFLIQEPGHDGDAEVHRKPGTDYSLRGQFNRSLRRHCNYEGGLTMNIAVIKHTPDNDFYHKYLFSVPEGVKLKAGDAVMCKTRYGEAFGWLVYDSFEAEGAALKAISDAYGAKELQPIIGVYQLSEFEDGTVQELDADSVRGKEVTCITTWEITKILRPEDWDNVKEGSVLSAKHMLKSLKKACDDVQCLGTKFFIRDGE